MAKANGKTALITGSTDGVGRVVAKRLAEGGWRVLLYAAATAGAAKRWWPRLRPPAEPWNFCKPIFLRSPRCGA